MSIILRPKLGKSLAELGFMAALWGLGVVSSDKISVGFKVVGIAVPLAIPAALVAAIAWTKVALSDDGRIVWTIAGIIRHQISIKDVVRYDDGYLVMGAARGLGAGKAFIITYREGGKKKELRFSSKLYDKADVESLKKFIDGHRSG